MTRDWTREEFSITDDTPVVDIDELIKENEAFERLATNLEKDCERLQKQLDIALRYFSLIKRNVSIGSLVYTYIENAKTEIKELNNVSR